MLLVSISYRFQTVPQVGFEGNSQDQHGIEQILQIDDAVDCAGSFKLDPTCVKCDMSVSRRLSPQSESLVRG